MPEVPRLRLDPTSDELQAVCNAFGQLRYLAEYPADPITAFELLKLDPRGPPFFPPENSRRPVDVWYNDVQQIVEQRSKELLERAHVLANVDGSADEVYKKAVTMSASPLLKDGPRRYYLETVLPSLERAILGKDRQGGWDQAEEFHTKLCRRPWPSTDMRDLGKEEPYAHR